MEHHQAHSHRYVYHLEVVIGIIGLVMVGFGIYEAAEGQTAGINPNMNPGMYKFYDPNANVTAPTAGGILPYGTGNTYTYPTNTYNPSTGSVSPNTTTGSTPTPPATTGGNVYGGSGTGYGSGGGSYYGTSGGYYGQGGLIDPGAYKTQGGYIMGQSGVFGQPGLNEAGAVRTQGVNTTISTTTNQNLSPKNCEFITRYHKFGDRGGDVPKIQTFLRDRGYYNGKIDGVYGISTFKAVRAFQKDYAEKVLSPWDIPTEKPTGITYISTKYAINKIVGCPDPATIIPKTGKVLNY